jgi:hypothetical protein
VHLHCFFICFCFFIGFFICFIYFFIFTVSSSFICFGFFTVSVLHCFGFFTVLSLLFLHLHCVTSCDPILLSCSRYQPKLIASLSLFDCAFVFNSTQSTRRNGATAKSSAGTTAGARVGTNTAAAGGGGGEAKGRGRGPKAEGGACSGTATAGSFGTDSGRSRGVVAGAWCYVLVLLVA